MKKELRKVVKKVGKDKLPLYDDYYLQRYIDHYKKYPENRSKLKCDMTNTTSLEDGHKRLNKRCSHKKVTTKQIARSLSIIKENKDLLKINDKNLKVIDILLGNHRILKKLYAVNDGSFLSNRVWLTVNNIGDDWEDEINTEFFIELVNYSFRSNKKKKELYKKINGFLSIENKIYFLDRFYDKIFIDIPIVRNKKDLVRWFRWEISDLESKYNY